MNSIQKGKKTANIMRPAPTSAKRTQGNDRLSIEEKLHIHASEGRHLPSKISKPFDMKAQKYFKTGPTISQNNSTSVGPSPLPQKSQTKINTFFTSHLTR